MQTETGLALIENVKEGDLVWPRDEATGAVALRRVTQTMATEGQPVLRIVLVDGTTAETLTATPNHPFWTRQRGWISAGMLKLGEQVLQRQGTWLEVVAVERTPRVATVYNFAVEEFHTYFVGELGAWVHNTCFPDAKSILKLFNTNKDGWHRLVKRDILKEAGELMKQIGSTNPDIGVDAAGKILLRNPLNGKTAVTELLAEWFIQ